MNLTLRQFVAFGVGMFAFGILTVYSIQGGNGPSALVALLGLVAVVWTATYRDSKLQAAKHDG